MVCGQAERGQFSCQLALPIIPQSFSGRTGKFLPLPLHKVRVTVFQRNKVCSGFIREALIQLSNFIQQQRKRPVIRNQVMHGKVQQVFFFRAGIKGSPEQWAER